jgi:hypothetical protein
LLFSSTSAILAMQSTNTVFVSAEVVLAVSLRKIVSRYCGGVCNNLNEGCRAQLDIFCF